MHVNTIEQLESMKDEEAFQKLSSEAKHFASQIQCDEIDDQPVSKRMRRMPLHLQDSIVCEVTSDCSTLSNEIAEKQRYKEVIDKILAEMRRRFDITNMSIMKAVQALLPHSDNFFNASVIEPLASHYSLDVTKLEVELPLAARVVKDGIGKIIKESQLSKGNTSPASNSSEEVGGSKESIIGLEDVLLSLQGFEAAFPQTTLVLRIAVTLGVSSSSCERSFSCVKRVKTFLRSSMTTERLSALAILSTDVDLASSIDFEDFLRIFVNYHNNRRIILF